MKGYVNLTHTNNSAIEKVSQKIDEIQDDYVSKDTTELTNYYTKNQTYTKEEIDNKTANVYRAKGSVQTYQDLPTEGNQVGDVYNVIEAYEDYPAGTNFVWTDTSTWDALGGEISVIQGVSQADFDKLVNNETEIVSAKNGFSAGSTANVWGDYQVAIGNGVNIGTGGGSEGVAIGYKAQARNYWTIGIGSQATGRGNSSIAIGRKATINSDSITNAIQLGTGTNSNDKTLQVWDDNIYNGSTHTLTVQNAEINGTPAYGVLSGTSAPTTTTVGAVGQFYLDTTNKQLYQCMSITTETVDEVDTNVYEWTNLSQSGVSQEDFDALVNNETQIQKSGGGFIAGGLADADSNSVAIGYRAKAEFYAGQVAIGGYTSAYAAGSVAIGNGAKTTKSEAIQLGSGTNNTANSLQIYNDNIYKANTHTLTVNNIEQNGNPVYAVLQGTTAPDATTVGAVTQFYLNTTDKKLYQCKSITTSETDSTSTYEWQEVGGSSSGGEIQEIQLDDTLTTGTLTSEQLATLQESKTNYIVYGTELFKLVDNNTSGDTLIYTCSTNDNGTLKVKSITVTISTLAWTYSELSSGGSSGGVTKYQHNIELIASAGVEDTISFSIITDDNLPYKSGAEVYQALANIGIKDKPIIATGIRKVSNYTSIIINIRASDASPTEITFKAYELTTGVLSVEAGNVTSYFVNDTVVEI